jgi:hypothetical protein
MSDPSWLGALFGGILLQCKHKMPRCKNFMPETGAEKTGEISLKRLNGRLMTQATQS